MTLSRSLVILSLILTFGTVFETAYAQIETVSRTDQLIDNAHQLVAVDADGCLKNSDPDEIVVCAAFDANRKYRLPFPELLERGQRIREPIPTGNAEYVNTGRCYVDASERKCFKGLPIMTISFGGPGGGVDGPAGKLWRVIKPTVPDEDYVKQVQIRANEPE
ncbi:hypothetical protein [Parasphingorhabdus cellanae]|uniref:Uncharacterized protein n=1 Tax=Parasphingorhabdus cellanae TaxID=2806553 RepID=A0ABX7TAL0_9SPHN|nr:hypothetical protein [Parasphingorhabdus cellanae]QTD57253.1 hypothetical protein J4G78_06880 [Parasphingorhabdus cellanae]